MTCAEPIGSDGGESQAGGVALAILVPGYGGRARFVERWRMNVARKTLALHGGGRLVVSGYQGEAERLAALAPEGTPIVVEPTARSTFENVERSLPFLRDAERIAIASDRGHRRRAASNLGALRPDLASRLVEPAYTWRDGWWMDAAGTAYEWVLRVRRAWVERHR
ncbi:ElyC/SanA/YdcF family protein [Aquihabitans daechungensis]|uniref:ElyC/SanA/YdcF family protein n=1 Tax=Aquihabitans daechungensis TaxID=1052257 RepID=UPI003BA27EB7